MPTVHVDGLEIEIEKTGEGPPVLCVHGSLSDRRTWQTAASHLDGDRAVYSYSRRFHRPNSAPENPEDYVVATHVADLAAVINGISDSPVDVVGHGYGGFIALTLAAAKPALLRCLVVMEPPIMSLITTDGARTPEMIAMMRSHPELGFHIAKYRATTLRPARRAAEQRRMEKAAYIFSQGLLGKTAFGLLSDQRWDQVLDNNIQAEFLKTLFPQIAETQIQAIRQPVLVISGEESPKIWRLLCDHLASVLPDAKRVQIKKAGHLAHEDRPVATAKTIQEFLASR